MMLFAERLITVQCPCGCAICAAFLLTFFACGLSVGISIGKRRGFAQAWDGGLNAIKESWPEVATGHYEPQSELAIAPAFQYPQPRETEPIAAVAGTEGDWPEDDAWTEDD